MADEEKKVEETKAPEETKEVKDADKSAKPEKTKAPEIPVQVKIDRGEELVDFMIPRTSADDGPKLIGVNGDFIRVMPGEVVTVKRKFVEAWENARRQERIAWETQTKAQFAAKKALADL